MLNSFGIGSAKGDKVLNGKLLRDSDEDPEDVRFNGDAHLEDLGHNRTESPPINEDDIIEDDQIIVQRSVPGGGLYAAPPDMVRFENRM